MSKNLTDLVAFTRSVDLVADVYEITSTFPKEEKYGLVAQMRRCASGVASQIAEGEGRATYGERRQFLSQARGSLFELEAQGLIAVRLGFMCDAVRLRKGIRKTGAALVGYLRWVEKQERASKPKSRRVLASPSPRVPKVT
jgi:four helix bundle protein